MIEEINELETKVAVILRKNFSYEGIKFLNDPNDSLQLGYMKRDKSYLVKPHYHKKILRKINRTMEVLFIKSGSVEIDFYGEKQNFIETKLLYKGDVVILMRGGHGIKVLEKSEIIEVKQGPYLDINDKSLIDENVHTSK